MTQASTNLSNSFAARLSLALKALNLSRSQLAAAADVDKSLVSRWLSGQVTPSAYNLARVSRALAEIKPGFNMTLWERPSEEFELFLGVCTPVAASSAVETHGGVLDQILPGEKASAPSADFRADNAHNRWSIWRPGVAGAGIALLLAGVIAVIVLRLWSSSADHAPPLPHAAFIPPPQSVAVLPFVNMSGDPAQDYFSDGFSEELINDLANEPHLNVASRTSSFAFKGKNENIETIARTLYVQTIVEGSVREVGERVRITAQLINANNGYHLWSADYTRNLSDIISVQDELARAIAAQLTHRLVPASATRRPKIDPAAYRLFLEGIRQWNTLAVPENWRTSFAIFKQVTERAPDFADGFAWLSGAAEDLAENYDAAPTSDFAIAEEAAARALTLDPRNIRARTALEYVALDTWNWRDARSNFRILRTQSPNNTYTVSALWSYYWQLGFPDEALAEWQRLSSLNPAYYRGNRHTLWGLDDAGRYHDLVAVARAQLVQNPRDASRLALLCTADAATGQIAESRAVGERLHSLQTDFNSIFDFQDCQFYIAVATGNRPDALKILQIWESEFPDKTNGGPNISGINASAFGAIYVLFGDFNEATSWFERAYERREPLFFTYFYDRGFGYETALKKYRQTPGYKALAAKSFFREFLAEHDRVAAALAAHRDPLN